MMVSIERNPQKCFGMPSLTGRRLTVYDIVMQVYLEKNLTSALFVQEISREQSEAAHNYCSTLLCKTDGGNLSYCDGCLLRVMQDGDPFIKDDYAEVHYEDNTVITVSKVDNAIYLGSIEELEEEEKGKETWLIAKDNLERYFITEK